MLISEKSSSELVKLNENLNNLNLLAVFLYLCLILSPFSWSTFSKAFSKT